MAKKKGKTGKPAKSPAKPEKLIGRKHTPEEDARLAARRGRSK